MLRLPGGLRWVAAHQPGDYDPPHEFTDALTSLPNRSYFNSRVDQEISKLAGGESLAMLCLDLDRFKEVNDLFGHAAGDTVLQEVASRVTTVLGERHGPDDLTRVLLTPRWRGPRGWPRGAP